MKITKDILYKFFNGETTLEEEQQVRQYIEASADNWKEYLRERKLYDTLILRNATICEKHTRRKQQLRKVMIECMKAAAILLIAFSTAFFWFRQPDKASGAMSVVSTLQGQMANITLPDGTRVWLNSNTRLAYPETFARGKREVQIEGEAYFEVFHNATQPFVVRTSLSEVEVLGTKFYVGAYPGSGEFETSLIEGSVRVGTGPSSLLLSPSYKAVLKSGKMVVQKITDFDAYRWREGLICFKSKHFTDILAEFEKYYGVRIDLSQKEANNPVLTAKFRVSDGIEYALRVLQRDVDFTYSRNDDENKITIQ